MSAFVSLIIKIVVDKAKNEAILQNFVDEHFVQHTCPKGSFRTTHTKKPQSVEKTNCGFFIL